MIAYVCVLTLFGASAVLANVGGDPFALDPVPVGFGSGDLTTLEKCSGYVPFKGDFICPENKVDPLYHFDVINREIENGRRSFYNDVNYQQDIDYCVNKTNGPLLPEADKIKALRAKANLLVEFSEMCRPEDTPIYYVWSKNMNLNGQPDVCVLINNVHLRQSLSFTRCVDPLNSDSDLCRLDYSTRVDYRCVQSGFIRKRVIVYCPTSPVDGYYETQDFHVPTACSCRKCGHCQGNDQVVDELNALFQMQSAFNTDLFNFNRK